jgi:hypothetical protein
MNALSNTALVLFSILMATAISGLIYFVLGGGRSLGAYVLGAAALLACFAIVVLMVAVFGWLADQITAWLQRLGKR